MARTMQNRVPVRMGTLNLLVMVIALSLAVLAVLALTTAQAGRTLSQREAESTQATYACETAGQQFLAAIDAQLASLHIDGGATPEHLLRTMQAAAPLLAATGEEGDLPAQFGMQGRVDALTTSQATELLGTRIEALAPRAVGALQGSFTTEGDQNLTCLVALNDDGTYTVIQWQQSKLWGSTPEEQLFQTS